MSRSRLFAVLTASIGHDIAHPGVNQQFLVQTRDELAMTYNDNSVLENMHCAKLYAIMRQAAAIIKSRVRVDARVMYSLARSRTWRLL